MEVDVSRYKSDIANIKIDSKVPLYNTFREDLPIKPKLAIPFNGYLKSNLGKLELGPSHIWDIQIEPYSHNGGKMPPKLEYEKISFLPASTFTLTDNATSSESLDMFVGSSINIPTNVKLEKSLSITLYEDSTYSVKNWLGKYKSFMFDDYRVMPYKNSCSKITIWILDYSKNALYIKRYYGYPINIDMSITGEESASPMSIPLEFAIVGEESDMDISDQLDEYLKEKSEEAKKKTSATSLVKKSTKSLLKKSTKKLNKNR
jgi:hypothetical protein